MDDRLKLLIDAGLFGQGLTLVNTPELVDRYNNCLKILGLEPTTLESFSIDGIGWSPEIAQALGNPMYLSHGDANQLAIIISPDQEHKPIYFPFTSFDRPLMVGFFDQFRRAITDITTTSGIALDIDQDLTSYESILDLLLVEYVVVKSYCDDLIEAAKEQKELTERFLGPGNDWADKNLAQQIINSARQYKDLRIRTVEIPEWRYAGLKCFYNRAFNGVFVFRDLPGGDFMVIEDSKISKKTRTSSIDVYQLTDKKLIDRLEEAGLITVDLNWYREHPEILEEKRECLLIDMIAQADPEVDYLSLTPPQKKAWLAKLGNKVPKIFKDLERLIKRLEQDEIDDFDELSEDLELLLLQPNQDLEEEMWELVGMLIARLQPWRLLITFTCDKNLFYSRYADWPKAKQLWSIAVLKQHYQPKMDVLKQKRNDTDDEQE